FGRGSLELVGCPNRKVLAFLRRDEHETILIVVNLARTLQPAELDRTSFAGLIPVEMTGLTEFPRIRDRPYFLSLSGDASHRSTLQQARLQIAQQPVPAADPITTLVASLPSLLVGSNWGNILDSSTRSLLERQALAPFLQRQRWFASKARRI